MEAAVAPWWNWGLPVASSSARPALYLGLGERLQAALTLVQALVLVAVASDFFAGG